MQRYGKWLDLATYHIRLPQEFFSSLHHVCTMPLHSIHSQAETAAQTLGAQLSNRGSPFCLLFGCMALHLNPSQREKLCSREGISSESKIGFGQQLLLRVHLYQT